MMSTVPPFPMNREQATRLQSYIQTYRQYAFSAMMPSVERNTTLRILQVIQGKVIEAMDQKMPVLQVLLTREERVVLKSVASELLQLSARQPESEERLETLGDLAALKRSLNT
jgi:Trp operon repressor